MARNRAAEESAVDGVASLVGMHAVLRNDLAHVQVHAPPPRALRLGQINHAWQLRCEALLLRVVDGTKMDYQRAQRLRELRRLQRERTPGRGR